jgi:hypothetical protein
MQEAEWRFAIPLLASVSTLKTALSAAGGNSDGDSLVANSQHGVTGADALFVG